MNNHISKKMWFGFLSIVFVFFVIIFIMKFPQYAKYHLTGTDSDKIVKEYDTSLQVEMFGDSTSYEMGLNVDNRPVFKDKWKALSQLKKIVQMDLKT